MTSTVCVPIFKVSTKYLVRRGRVWTPLEHMILCKLEQASATSLEIARLADLPVNLIIEALIELMRARWVQINAKDDGTWFEITSSGSSASKQKNLPHDWTTHKRGTLLCMDRIVASFLRPDDLTLIHRDNIPTSAIVLNPREFRLSMSPSSSLDRLYMLDDEMFEEWIDYRVTSQNLLAVTTITDDGHVEGLPSYASPMLEEIIREEAKAARGQSVPGTNRSGLLKFEPPDRHCTAQISAEDFIVGGLQHRTLIEDMLKNAKSSFVVHSCFLHPNAVTSLLPSLKKAAIRGVAIEVLWGQRTDELADWSKKAFQQVKDIFDGLPQSFRNRIRFSDRETGSHAKILIADSGKDHAYEAYIGSCNWLSAQYDALEIGLRIREPRIIAFLAAQLAEMRTPTSGPWTADVHRLVGIFNSCRRLQTERAGGTHSLAIVLDREHLAIVREVRDIARNRIYAGCDLFGPAGETSVLVPMVAAVKAAENMSVRLLFKRPTKSMAPGTLESLENEMKSKGVDLQAADNIHGKFLISDNDFAVITSFNWLSATADPWKPAGAEIGVIIKGDGLGKILRHRIDTELDTKSK